MLFLLEREQESVDYDEYNKVMIRAKTKSDAIKLAADNYYGFAEPLVKVTEIKQTGKTEVVMESFCAG